MASPMKSLALAAILAGLAPIAAVAQDASPQAPTEAPAEAPLAPVAKPTSGTAAPPSTLAMLLSPPKTWEDIPPALREKLAPMLDTAPPQSRLVVEQALPEDSAPRPVEQRTIIALQTVRPAPGVTLSESPEGKAKLGAPGDVLWPAVVDGGEVYCRKAGDLQCFRDNDKDGRFDDLIRVGGQNLLEGSAFQLARSELAKSLKAPAAYARTGATAPHVELLGLRYGGPAAGPVGSDGKLREGLVEFLIVAGSDRGDLHDARPQLVRLSEGRGVLELGAYRVEISDVTVDGPASIRVRSALPAGPALLTPLMTKADAVKMVRAALGAED
ncbi:hypothetical protein AS593_21350 [Caulobacter vibrioides]|nr:hypothetical protein AS593_21350 [Caulobacter vibrioides]